MRRYFCPFLLCLLPGLWGVQAQPGPDLAGRIIATSERGQIEMPLLKSDLKVDIQGDMATVHVTQLFENPSQQPMSADYLFPLNQGAAVYAMRMHIGDDVIDAKIERRSKAEAQFHEAEAQGKAAALLTQHRPNIFTQTIANLMPGQPITVTLSYVQSVPKRDGAYELVLPLVTGPRYETPAPPAETRPEPIDGWQVTALPSYPPVMGLTLPEEIDQARVSLDLHLTAAVPVVDLTSATHALTVTRDGATWHAGFEAGRVIDNRDLVLRYVIGDAEVSAGGLSHYGGQGGFLSVLIDPPRIAAPDHITAREVVFVLDTSGSMGGAPLAASKGFMQAALQGLRPQDYFRVIRFASDASAFSDLAVPATPANIRAGLTYVRGLQASGGTEIDLAMQRAFATHQPANTLRLVVFLSDGYIGDEASVLRRIRRQIGQARIYAFGVGTSVNRYLLDAMAEEGRGYARYVDPTEDAADVAQTLAQDLKSPVLTDIVIDWGGLEVRDVVPGRIPDLFEGGSVRVLARYHGSGPAQIGVKGRVHGRPAHLPVALDLAGPSDQSGGPAIPLTWARQRIADLERDLAVGVQDADELQDQITDLGLGFHLQTRFTSFVAISSRVVNDSGVPADRVTVPLPQVAGVGPGAYPSAGFSGASTPEPQIVFGLMIVLAMAALRFAGRRPR